MNKKKNKTHSNKNNHKQQKPTQRHNRYIILFTFLQQQQKKSLLQPLYLFIILRAMPILLISRGKQFITKNQIVYVLIKIYIKLQHTTNTHTNYFNSDRARTPTTTHQFVILIFSLKYLKFYLRAFDKILKSNQETSQRNVFF